MLGNEKQKGKISPDMPPRTSDHITERHLVGWRAKAIRTSQLPLQESLNQGVSCFSGRESLLTNHFSHEVTDWPHLPKLGNPLLFTPCCSLSVWTVPGSALNYHSSSQLSEVCISTICTLPCMLPAVLRLSSPNASQFPSA